MLAQKAFIWASDTIHECTCEPSHFLMLHFAVAWPEAQLLLATSTEQLLRNR